MRRSAFIVLALLALIALLLLVRETQRRRPTNSDHSEEPSQHSEVVVGPKVTTDERDASVAPDARSIEPSWSDAQIANSTPRKDGAPEPADARPVMSMIRIVSQHPGTEIVINGIEVGQAPVTIESTVGTDLEVLARAEGRKDETIWFTVTALREIVDITPREP